MVELRYTKFFTVKEWKKFDRVAERENGIDITMQEVLLKKYEIILTDYKTKKEKLFAVMDKFNAKNINAGIDKFNKGVDQFSEVLKSTKGMGISQKDYDSLLPKKKHAVSFFSEPKKRKSRKKQSKQKAKEPDYSALIGKRKVKFF